VSGELARALEQYGERLAKSALPAALYKEGFRTLAVAIPLAPVEYGHLRRSGYVAPPVPLPGGGVRVVVGFGMVYAHRQHEELKYRHPRGGQAKYLATAIERRRPSMLAAVAGDVVQAMRSGTAGAPIGRAAPPAPKVGGQSLQAHNRKLFETKHPSLTWRGRRKKGGKR
jgi:hypothetical protein